MALVQATTKETQTFIAARDVDIANKRRPIALPSTASGSIGTALPITPPRRSAIKIPRKVLKDSLPLCAPNYCRRCRPAARRVQPIDTSISHVGFRCVIRETTAP